MAPIGALRAPARHRIHLPDRGHIAAGGGRVQAGEMGSDRAGHRGKPFGEDGALALVSGIRR